jgi:uncharacterized membrane protein
LLLGVAGLAVSAYLMATHYFAANVPLACSSSGIVDCEEVTTSAESMIGPLPVAVLGAIWFVALLVMVAAHRQWPYGPWMWIQVGWAIGGLLFVFYLVYAELFLIGSICSWCTVVHAIVVVLFLLTIYEATAPGEPLTSVG